MEEEFGMTDPEEPVQVARLRYALYVETLRASGASALGRRARPALYSPDHDRVGVHRAW